MQMVEQLVAESSRSAPGCWVWHGEPFCLPMPAMHENGLSSPFTGREFTLLVIIHVSIFTVAAGCWPAKRTLFA